ncbi:MAG: succinate dehydrogenase, cytochrome b556 subunit [Pseudomonadota bacterium]
MSQLQDNRPLSPHLGIYRWQISNTLSILHRLTGVGLTLGLVPFALWLWAAAYDPALFDCLSTAAASIIGKLFLFGWTVAFYYHLGNGIRHLNWDLGRGFKLDEMAASGWVVVSFAVFISIFTWVLIYQKVGL